MPQAKKKKSTKTAKKGTTTKVHKCSATCSHNKNKKVNSGERTHVYIIIALSITTGFLLLADVVMLAQA